MTLDNFIQIIKLNQLNESNNFKTQRHEKKFSQFFISNGFEQIDKTSDVAKKIKKIKSLTFDPEFSGQNFFISQPFGSQKTPDFIFVVNGWVVWIELKRSKGKTISWNTGYPKDNFLYIFDSEKLGRVIFFGQDHPIYGGKEKEYLEITNKIKLFSKELFDDTDFKHYFRKMLNDSGEYNIDYLYNKVIITIENLN